MKPSRFCVALLDVNRLKKFPATQYNWPARISASIVEANEIIALRNPFLSPEMTDAATIMRTK
jgi:hypothetical protein